MHTKTKVVNFLLLSSLPVLHLVKVYVFRVEGQEIFFKICCHCSQCSSNHNRDYFNLLIILFCFQYVVDMPVSVELLSIGLQLQV